jgi:hypothetical protein
MRGSILAMVSPELLEYIRQQSAAGVSRVDITNILAQQGWLLTDISDGFNQVAPVPMAPAPSAPNVPMMTMPTMFPTVAASQPTITERPANSVPRKLLTAAAVLIVLSVGGLVYAYAAKIGPFASAPYDEGDLITGILSATSKMTSASYAATVQLNASARDADAKPFTLQVSNQAKLAEQYKNDAARTQDISTLLSTLRSMQGAYPASLSQLSSQSGAKSGVFLTRAPSIIDPVSGQQYQYMATADGTNFLLIATFETPAAISLISSSYGFAATTTIIRGQTVSFTKDSPSYFYLSPEPPKPLLVNLGEMVRFLSPEVRMSAGVSASADWSKVDVADWKFNIDATGDFGDLSYKVDADALKKGSAYYFRINNMPAFGSELSAIKGQWVKVETATTTADSAGYGGELQYLAAKLPEIEKGYKDSRTKMTDSLRRLAAFADEVHLLSFKNPPHSEQIDGQALYRYDLQINKDAILPFYKKALEEANANPSFKDLGYFSDQGMVDYLQSKEFSQVFDYYNSNTTWTIWVDQNGYPAQATYTMRIVPPDTATQLSQKQFNSIFTLSYKNVNEPVDIATPDKAKPIQDVISDIEKNMNDPLSAARANGADAAVQSDLSTIQTQGEIYFGGTGLNSYGKQPWIAGAATSCKTGMFKDSTISSILAAADKSNGDGKNVACYAYGTGYVVGAEITSGWWCIDSTGSAKLETGVLPSAAPVGKSCP